MCDTVWYIMVDHLENLECYFFSFVIIIFIHLQLVSIKVKNKIYIIQQMANFYRLEVLY